MFKFFESNESPLERFFRTEYAKEHRELAKAGVKPSDRLIKEIIKGDR